MSYDPLLESLGLYVLASPTLPATFQANAYRGGVAIEPSSQPSNPTPGTMMVDVGDLNTFKVWDGTTWRAMGAAAGSDGYIQFAMTGFMAASSDLQFDYTNNRLVTGGLVITPASLFGVPAIGQLSIDSGDSNILKWWDGSSWVSAGSSASGITGTIELDQIAVGTGTDTIGGSSNFTFSTAYGLLIQMVPTTTFTPVSVTGDENGYLEINIQNQGIGGSSSTDLVATADTGTSTTNFIDVGINGSAYSGGIFGAALEGYLYTSDQNLNIGAAASGKVVKVLAGGSNIATNTVLTLAAATSTFSNLTLVTPGTTATDVTTAFLTSTGTTTATLTGTNRTDAVFGFVAANGTVAASAVVTGVRGVCQVTPSGATVGEYDGIEARVTRITDTSTNSSGATFAALSAVVNYGMSNTSGTTAAALYGVKVSPGVINSAVSGSSTITAVYGLSVAPTLATSVGGVTTTISTYYGLFLGTVSTSGSGTNTITTRYGVFQQDASAINSFAGLVTTAASTTTVAGLRIPHGTAPSAPVNGDLWTTTAAVQVRLNGATQSLVNGTGAANQMGRWTGTNTFAGLSSCTMTTTSGADILVHAAGTSTATTATNAALDSVTFSGIFTTGPVSAIAGTATFSGATNTATVILTGGYFSTTATGTIANAHSVSGSYSNLVATPGGTLGAINYVGDQGLATVTSATNARFAAATLIGTLAGATFNSADTTSVAVAAAVVGAKITHSVVTTNASGTSTIANVYGVWVSPGTFSSSGGGGLTITNYYGLRIDTLTLSTMTVTNRYGVFQADAAATNSFAGLVLTAASVAGNAGLRLPHGTAPSSPVNGDMWTTTAGVFARINGSTVGPFGAASPAGSNTEVQFNNAGAFGASANLTWDGTTFGIGTSTGTSKLSVTGTNVTGANTYALVTVTRAVAGAAGDQSSFRTNVSWNTQTTNNNSHNGYYASMDLTGSNAAVTASSWNGMYIHMRNQRTAGRQGGLYGINTDISAEGTGGTTDYVYAANLSTTLDNGHTITNEHVGVAIDVNTNGVVTTVYGIYLNVRGTGTITNQYGIYQDGGTATNVFEGLVVTSASTSVRAGLRLTHGAAPSSPVDGDFWTTTTAAAIQTNGVTHTLVHSVPADGTPVVYLAGTAAPSSGVDIDLLTLLTAFAPSTSAASQIRGLYTVLTTSGTNAQNSSLSGVGVNVTATCGAASSSIANATGGVFFVDIQHNASSGSTTTTEVSGLKSTVLVRSLVAGSTWTVSDVYGAYIYMSYSNTGTLNVTNSYGVYIDDSGTTSNATNRYGIYQVGVTSSLNHFGSATYFGTTIGVGVANSSSTFCALAAGTTAKSSLRIAHGVAPTAPVNGDLWTVSADGFFIYINGVTQWISTGLGVPAAEAGNRTITNADNGKNLICTGSLTFTVNTGLLPGFGCSFKGTVAFTGSATVTDVRTTGATNPWCALCCTGTNTYDVVGSKA